eukprot:5682059-Amphidinium_carterae.1
MTSIVRCLFCMIRSFVTSSDHGQTIESEYVQSCKCGNMNLEHNGRRCLQLFCTPHPRAAPATEVRPNSAAESEDMSSRHAATAAMSPIASLST